MPSRILPPKWLLAALTAGWATAAALVHAPPASATPESNFFDLLMAGGITVFDAGGAVNRGYLICGAMNSANGEQIAQDIFASADPAEVPTIEVARVWVVASGMALCPWHYHPERGDQRQVMA